MNEPSLLLARMLKTFPVKALKEAFDITGLNQSEAINQIIETNSSQQILDYVFSDFGFLRQHVYVYNLNKQIPNGWTPYPVAFKSQQLKNGYKVYNLLFTATYNVINTATGEFSELMFHMPVQVWTKGVKIIIKINTLERNPNDYFEDKVIVTKKDLNEEVIVAFIRDSLPAGVTFVSCDLNKGVKALWEEDFIDCHSIRYKKTSSTSTEVMDEEDTLKSKYPELYKQIILAPIDSNLFKILGDNGDDLISHFKVEPSSGKFSFVKFPSNTDAISDLIEIILSKN